MLSRSEGLKSDERASSLLGKMIDSSKRMQTLINDLLDISVISRQKSFESANLSLLLREVVHTLEHKIEETGAVIEADALPEATVVPAQIRQLFQNLLSNAIKFRKPDEAPHIRIKTRALFARDAQELGLPGHQAFVQIEFADNGIGFSNEYAQKIFTIFQRLHGKSEYEGSGIGLAICKKIAEHHGGAIWAEGELGKGSVFTLVLPV
jgi:signal transduction histidine kinase